MTKKFDELYENIQLGFPISVQNTSRQVNNTVIKDMGKEINDERLAHYANMGKDKGKATNEFHPTNLKVRTYMRQLKSMSEEELFRLAEMIGMPNPEVSGHDDIINAIVNHLGEDPKNWKVLSPFIFTEGEEEEEDEDELDETSEDDSEWVTQKSHDDNWMAEDDEDDEDDEDEEFYEDDEDDEELDERIVKDKKFRKGHLTTVMKTDKENTKIVSGKEVKMDVKEIKNREKAATEREKGGGTAKKRQKSFKATIQAKRNKLKKKK